MNALDASKKALQVTVLTKNALFHHCMQSKLIVCVFKSNCESVDANTTTEKQKKFKLHIFMCRERERSRSGFHSSVRCAGK